MDLDTLKARAAAATPGPWDWEVGPKQREVRLATRKGIVMDFVRWGMDRAAPRFNVDGVMRRVDEVCLPEPGREHHAEWHQIVSHPDACYIEAVSPDVVLALVARVEQAEAERDEAVAELNARNAEARYAADPDGEFEQLRAELAALKAERTMTPADWIQLRDQVVDRILERRHGASGVPCFLDAVVLRGILQPLLTPPTGAER